MPQLSDLSWIELFLFMFFMMLFLMSVVWWVNWRSIF